MVAQSKTTLPTSFSLKKYCPKPTTQLSFKTSAGWASAYYGMTILEAKKRGLSDIKEITQNSFAPVFAYTSPTNNNPKLRNREFERCTDLIRGIPKSFKPFSSLFGQRNSKYRFSFDLLKVC
ncbi:MAG: hypothetical protein AAF149_23635, partial [Bacteroidota bacterium]